MADTLEQIQDHLSTLKNQAGQPVRLRPDATGTPQATLPVGRVVVAPGLAVEASEWGNVAHDQTLLVFANASARSAQWPSPLEGARSWLADSHSLWAFTQGKWTSPAAGYTASQAGPAAQADVSSGSAFLATLTWPAVVGRHYSITMQTLGTNQGTAATTVIMAVAYITVPAPYAYYGTVPPGGPFTGNSGWQWTATTTAGRVAVQASCFGAGPARFAANSCHISVTDLGSA